MSRTRKLTMTGKRGNFKLRFRDVANQDMKFEGICAGRIVVNRSANGTTYLIDSSTDNWRVLCNIITPDDTPNLFYWDYSQQEGYWTLEGYQQVRYTPDSFPSSFADEQNADETSNAELGDPEQVDPA